MTTAEISDPFTTLADERTLADTIVALEEHGFGVEVVDDLDRLRDAVLARVAVGASVMTNASVTLLESGIDEAINSSGNYDSVRNRMVQHDCATQRQEMERVAGQSDYSLGSVHAV